MKFTDKERIDWLEREAMKPEGILLHDSKKSTGRLGLGLCPGGVPRTLREAIDGCLQYEKGSEELRRTRTGGAFSAGAARE